MEACRCLIEYVMKSLLSLLVLLSAYQFSNGQPLGEISIYLKNPAISKAAKIYYAGKFRASDDDTTFSILDSLRTKSDTNRPFYILLVSKMAKSADGALAEAVFPTCVDFFYKQPDDLIEFLYAKSQNANFKSYWALAIVQGLDLDDKYDQKELINSALKKCKPQNRENIKSFWKKVSSQIK